MVTREAILKAVKGLKLGEGFEAGDLFPNLPNEELVYWHLEAITKASNSTKYKFSLMYRDIFIRTETLKFKKGELNA